MTWDAHRDDEDAQRQADCEDCDTEAPMPECQACEDTGYEFGMPGYYCTFCKKGCAIAHEQVKHGIDPWNVDGQFDADDQEDMP